MFNVIQFFEGDIGHETVRQNVDAGEAVRAFDHYTNSVGARLGMTVKVIITDENDEINAEWQYGRGITFPTPDQAYRGDENHKPIAEAMKVVRP